jgi:hypothetical protein
MKARSILLLGGGITVAASLAYGHVARSKPTDDAAIWVYYTSLCQTPGDTTSCTEIKQPVRRAFESEQACSAYRAIDLDRANNPRLLGSCLRQHEA